MRKSTLKRVSRKGASRVQRTSMTLAIDLGNRISTIYGLDVATGETMGPSRLPTTQRGMEDLFARFARTRVVMETGTHANWVARLAEAFGHEVIVAQSRKLALISTSRGLLTSTSRGLLRLPGAC